MKEHHRKESPILNLLGLSGGIGGGLGVGGAGGPISASGGTTTSAGIIPGNGYRYHVFTTSGSLVVASGADNIEYLVVGGGGQAGGYYGGGAGGGCLLYTSPSPRD